MGKVEAKRRNPQLWAYMLLYGFSEHKLARVVECANSIALTPTAWSDYKKRKKVKFQFSKRAAPSDKFYRSVKWRKARLKAIEKYGSVCMRCGETEKTQVDHVKPRSRYPEMALDVGNMQILCWPCNKAKSDRHEIDYRCEPQQGIA